MEIKENRMILNFTIILKPNEIDPFLNIILFALDYESANPGSLYESEKQMANELVEKCKRCLSNEIDI